MEHCPDPRELTDYLVGKLSDDRSDALTDQLDRCSHCQERIRLQPESADTFEFDPLRPIPDDPFDAEPELREALMRSAAFVPRGGHEGATTEAGRIAPGRIGDYELLEVIARGGMGIVYRALQMRLNRIVALKTIRDGELASGHEAQRFHVEAKLAAKLDHPGIVPIYEVGEESGRHFAARAGRGKVGIGRSAFRHLLAGATLYCILTGRPPFQAATTLETLKQMLEQDPVAPRRLNAAVGRDLNTICRKCLEKRPERRYGSASELAEDLTRFRAGRSIRARPVGVVGRTSRWMRRQPVIAALMGAIVLLTAADVAAVTWEWRMAEALARSESLAKTRAEESAVEARRLAVAERWERYRSNIAAGLSSFQLNNGEEARRALDSSPEQFRDWEWRYLDSQSGGSRTVLRPGGSLRDAQFSREAGQVAYHKEGEGEIHLWDPKAAQEIAVLRGHGAPLRPFGKAYSPDGRRLASCSEDRTVRLWDTADGRQIAVIRDLEVASM